MSVSVCLYVCLHVCQYVCPHADLESHVFKLHDSWSLDTWITKFSVHVTVARHSDDTAIRYVFPVWWTTSCLSIIGQAKATPSGHTLKVIRQGAADQIWCLYDCLVWKLPPVDRITNEGNKRNTVHTGVSKLQKPSTLGLQGNQTVWNLFHSNIAFMHQCISPIT